MDSFIGVYRRTVKTFKVILFSLVIEYAAKRYCYVHVIMITVIHICLAFDHDYGVFLYSVCGPYRVLSLAIISNPLLIQLLTLLKISNWTSWLWSSAW